MTPDNITQALIDRFGSASCQRVSDDVWQVDTTEIRLIAIHSGTWFKLMIPIMPMAEAQPFVAQMMAENFDQTLQTRYAFHQNVVWGVFQYDLAALDLPQFQSAVDQLLTLKAKGVDELFARLVEVQITDLIKVSKQQGQSLEATMKTLDRFYSEGLMGDMEAAGGYQTEALAAWRRQLERLWPTV